MMEVLYSDIDLAIIQNDEVIRIINNNLEVYYEDDFSNGWFSVGDVVRAYVKVITNFYENKNRWINQRLLAFAHSKFMSETREFLKGENK